MKRGFTSLEALIGIFTFSILSLGVISLAVIGTRMAIDSERRVVALALVNERVEFIRSLPYEHIAYAPGGALVQTEVDVSRNQQSYDVETLISTDPATDPKGLQKKVQVTASWDVPAGGTRDVQVVTLVSASSPQKTTQINCDPSNSGGPFTFNVNTDDFYEDALRLGLTGCVQPAKNLPPWQCCEYSFSYGFDSTGQIVSGNYNCSPPPGLSGSPADHPIPGTGQYTDLARQCNNGTTCSGTPGSYQCDANCLIEPGDCECIC